MIAEYLNAVLEEGNDADIIPAIGHIAKAVGMTKELRQQGAKTEVTMTLKDGTRVRKDAVRPDGTTVIIKPNTKSGQKSAATREKLMEKNGHKTEKIKYDPKDPKYQPGSSSYIGPKTN